MIRRKKPIVKDVVKRSPQIRISKPIYDDLYILSGGLGLDIKDAADEALLAYFEKNKSLLETLKRERVKRGRTS